MASQSMRGRSAMIALLLFFSAGVAAYWVSFFTGGQVRANQDICYLVFERTFPASDAMTAASATACAIGLMRRKPWSMPAGFVAAGAMLFLGLIDVSYNAGNGMYLSLTPEMVAEVIINVFCLVFGALLIVFLWRNRAAFDD